MTEQRRLAAVVSADVAGMLAAIVWALVGLLALCTVALAQESRVALVIGNGAYKSTEPLRNPANDARAMAAALKRAGFEVIEQENASRRSMIEGFRAFGEKLTPGGIGLFFYAGHGIQARGANFLLPVDASLAAEDDLGYEALDVQDVLNRMDNAKVRLSLVILDACRDNPFARSFRSTARGLAQIDAPRGTVIAYATAPGRTAADGDGDNGLYTSELLRAMAEPGLKLEEVFKRAADAVERKSGAKQTPWISSSFRGDFYFYGPTTVTVTPPAAAPPATSGEAELVFWNSVKDSQDPAEYEAYLKRFPSGQFVDLAKARLERLKAAKLKQQTLATPPAPPAPPSMVRPAVGVLPVAPAPGQSFRDCPECPEMVVIPAGGVSMGVPAGEEEREGVPDPVKGRSVPQHRVTVGQFRLGKYEVTRGEFAAFVSATGYQADDKCWVAGADGKFVERPGHGWRDPGFTQTDRDPAVCVNWDDAKAYVDWLARKTSKSYRLPSEAEWEYAARARTATSRYWGDDATAACNYANAADQAAKQEFALWTVHECSDGHVYTAPVGSYRPNGFGVYDMLGNAWEWVEDCWNATYAGAPGDGTAWTSGECGRRVLRGGSLGGIPWSVRAGFRYRDVTEFRNYSFGFRVARTE